MLIRNLLPGYINRVYESANGLFEPASGLYLPKKNNIIIIKEGLRGKEMLLAANIVTTDGDVYYAQNASVETPTNDFTELTLSTNAVSPAPGKGTDAGDLVSSVAAGSGNVAATALYPQTDDGDADNTGAGTDIVTWLFEFTKASFNDPSVEGMAIHVTGATFGSGADPLLTSFNRTSFAKTADDTLKVFVNHDFLGA